MRNDKTHTLHKGTTNIDKGIWLCLLYIVVLGHRSAREKK